MIRQTNESLNDYMTDGTSFREKLDLESFPIVRLDHIYRLDDGLLQSAIDQIKELVHQLEREVRTILSAHS